MISAIAGRHILCVEDEAVLGMILADVLEDLGYTCICAASLPEAMDMAQAATFNGAILDVNLAGELSYPVAHHLRGRGVPLLFTSGSTSDAIDDAFKDCMFVEKPYRIQQLVDAIAATFNPQAMQSGA